MNKYTWVWLAPLVAFLAGLCSVVINLYSQYGSILQSSSIEHPISAAGGGLEIHDWFQQTLLNSLAVIGIPMALMGLILAFAINQLNPLGRQLLAGDPDSPAFDSLLMVAGLITWLTLLLILCPLISSAFVNDAACHQTFFK